MKRFIVFVCMLIAMSLSPPMLAADSGYNIPDKHFELGQVIVDLKACAECHNLGQEFPPPNKHKGTNSKADRSAAVLWYVPTSTGDPADRVYGSYNPRPGWGAMSAAIWSPD